MKLSPKSNSGFTLLEIILVLAILAVAYTFLVPNLALNRATEISVKLARLGSDVRSAYDLAVLSGKPHRLVFHLYSGTYWLESTEAQLIRLGDSTRDHDPTPDDAESEYSYRQEVLQEYRDLAAEDIVDDETGDTISVSSPVIESESVILGPTWYKVQSMEWRARTLGPELIIADAAVTHLSEVQSVDNLDEDAVVYIYILPSGYLEKAVLHLFERTDDGTYNPETPPYTIVTSPWTGEIEIRDGFEEESVRDEDE